MIIFERNVVYEIRLKNCIPQFRRLFFFYESSFFADEQIIKDLVLILNQDFNVWTKRDTHYWSRKYVPFPSSTRNSSYTLSSKDTNLHVSQESPLIRTESSLRENYSNFKCYISRINVSDEKERKYILSIRNRVNEKA